MTIALTLVLLAMEVAEVVVAIEYSSNGLDWCRIYDS
jgi:hypothetical protein